MLGLVIIWPRKRLPNWFNNLGKYRMPFGVKSAPVRKARLRFMTFKEVPMNDGESRDWKQLLDEIMSETDKKTIEKKTFELETALVLRSQQIHSDGGTAAERTAIKDATNKLLRVKVEKLGYPIRPEIPKPRQRQ
jgi:hypothetical protein